ncbi:MAG: TonB-dependent receptor, partial [Bacteroidota bacterium]
VDVNRTTLESNNLGERQRNAVSVFVEQRFSFLDKKLDITPGILFNYFSDFGSVFLAGIDAGYRLTDKVKLYANVGETYRVPTYTDLYYEDRANIGNPDLQPESAITYELGAKYQTRFFNAQASFFQRNATDAIDWTKEADTLRWQPRNFAALSARGLDISGDIRFSQLPLSLNLGYTFIDASIETAEDVEFSRYALDNLRHQLIAGVDVRILADLYANIQYRYNDRVTLDNYQVVDVRLSWRTDKLDAFAELSNAFNVRYQEANLVTMPGRWVRAGLSYKFTY